MWFDWKSNAKNVANRMDGMHGIESAIVSYDFFYTCMCMILQDTFLMNLLNCGSQVTTKFA